MVTAAKSVWSRVAEVASQLLTTQAAPANYVSLVLPIGERAPLCIVGMKDETATARTLFLEVGRALAGHHPGQLVALTTTIDEHFVTRAYRIVAAPGAPPGVLAITVDGEGGDAMDRFLAKEAEIGDYLTAALVH